MNADLILELVELAISFAETQLDGEDLNGTLLDIVYRGIQAYEDNSGRTLDVSELPI